MQLADEIQYEDDDIQIIGTHEPYGVIGAISPWNFPLILSSVKVASALATGNCVIIKPSPFTPYAILKFCELAQSVLPARGIFQALNGGADVGERMSRHPGIAHISFTGTIAVGQKIMANCAGTLKKVILELAGNDAAIVTDDVDLDVVVPKIALGCLLHAGQMCVASKRLYVHASRYDDFLAKFRAHLEKTYIATYEDADAPSVFGPLSNRPNYDRCRGFVEDCRKNGYEVITVGDDDAGEKKKGFWMAPTIIANPPEDSLVVREEQFGKPKFSLPISKRGQSGDDDDDCFLDLMCLLLENKHRPRGPHHEVGRRSRRRRARQPRQRRPRRLHLVPRRRAGAEVGPAAGDGHCREFSLPLLPISFFEYHLKASPLPIS